MMFFNKWSYCVLCFVLKVLQISAKHQVPFFLQSDRFECHTDDCIKNALYISSSINQSINPCADFYEYVCGAWVTNNPRPLNEIAWSQWEPVSHEIDQKIQKFLDDKTSNFSSNIGIYLARKMYQTCLKIDFHESDNIIEVLKLIESFFVWPNSDLMVLQISEIFDVIARINYQLNVFPLLKFHVATDLYNTSENILYIDYPNLQFPKQMLQNPHLYINQLNQYKIQIKKILQKITKNKNLDIFVTKIIEFEVKLSQIMTTKTEEISNLYKKLTIDQLQKKIPKINWTIMTSNFTRKKTLIIKNILFVKNLIKLLIKTPAETIYNYIGWTIFNYFRGEISSNFDQISHQTHEILYGSLTEISRQKKCFYNVNNRMKYATSYEYVRNYVTEDLRENVTKMTENVKLELDGMLDGFFWMDDLTRRYAQDKAANIKYVVGYPEFFGNLSFVNFYYQGLDFTENNIKNIVLWNNFMRQKEFDANNQIFKFQNVVTDVNAYYDVLKNSIIIPSGIMQPPFFAPNQLNALNYGALGTLIAHEFSHAFDNTGRQADKHGNIRQWWTAESQKKYTNHISCLKSQYDELYQKIFTHQKTQLNPKTMDENIADIIGLNLAFRAFLKNKQNFLLPGLDYTEEQLFFISFALQWCENATPEYVFMQVIDGDHTPNKLRVNGAVLNVKEFEEVFECRQNIKKCDL